MKIFFLLLFLTLSLFSQAPAGTAEMQINEFLYKQTESGKSNDEFIEFYVTASGDIEDYIFTDQDSSNGHRYFFPSQSVYKGDYVVLHVGEGTDSQDGNVYHFYMGLSPVLNNSGGDDILLLKPDETDTTDLEGTIVNAIPFDFVQYGTSGSALDSIPTSADGITVDWDDGENSRLINADSGTSISLTPNSNDSDTSLCWEMTATTESDDKATNCAHYIPTIDSNSDSGLTYSMGETNTYLPDIKLEKTSVTIYDPINLDNHSKAIPGAVEKYTLTLQNEGLGTTDNDSIHIRDSIPENMKICVSTVAQCKEASFHDGPVSSELSLGSITYFKNGAVYTPTADAEGYDTSVTEIEFNLDGVFAASNGTDNPSATIEFYMGVE